VTSGLRGVLFDYGDTLVTFQRPDAALRLAYQQISDRISGGGGPRLEPALLLSDVHDRVEAAYEAHRRSGAAREIDLVGEAARAYHDLGVDLDPAELDVLLRIEQEAWWDGVRVDPDAVPVLETLRAAGVRVGLCSNAPYRVRSLHEQLEHLGLLPHLDSVTFSGAVGWRKPSSQIFALALTELGVAAERCLMVGDSVSDDIDGARAAGMQTLLLRRGDDRAPRGGADFVAGSLRDVVTVVLAGHL
jgi:HAD superfamily hydrolase (TIGR01509 family)